MYRPVHTKPKPSKVPSVGIDLRTQNKIVETIRANQRAAHADPVQQRTLGKCLVNLIVAERQFHHLDGEQRVEVFVVPVGARLAHRSDKPTPVRKFH